MSMADRIAVMADGRVQQIASPVELYRRPHNLFVADFIGTSTLLAGRTSGATFVSDVLGPLPGTPATEVSDAEAHLVVRPESIRIVAESEGLVRGTVADTQFHGGVSTVTVDVAGLAHPFLVSVPGVTVAVRGTSVGLTWAETDAVVVRDELV